MPEKPLSDAMDWVKSIAPFAPTGQEGAPQPDLTEADAVREPGSAGKRFAKPIVDRVKGKWEGFKQGVIEPVKAVAHGLDEAIPSGANDWEGHPLQGAKTIYEGVKKPIGAIANSVFDVERIKQGDWEGSVPFAGLIEKAVEGAGEKYGMEDYAGMYGGATADVAEAVMASGAGGRLIGEPLAAAAEKVGLRRVSNAFMPRKMFMDKEARQIALGENDTALRRIADEGYAPNEASVVQSRKVANQTSQAYDDAFDAADATGTRLSMDEPQRVANPALHDEYNYGKRSTQGQITEIKQQVKDVQLKYADPTEIAKAKTDLANKYNKQYAQQYNANPNTPGSPNYNPMAPSKPQTVTPGQISDELLKAHDYPSTMRPSDFRKLRQQVRDQYTTPQGQLIVNGAVDKVAKKVAQTLDEVVHGSFPEIKQLGKILEQDIDVSKIVSEGALRASKRSIMGLSGEAGGVLAATGAVSAPVAGTAGMVASILRSRVLGAKIGSFLYRNSGGAITFGDVMMRLEAAASVLEDVDAKQEKEDEASQAKH